MSLLSPSLLLILILSLIYGTLFHLWRGRTWGDLGLFLLVALVGMLVAQPLGTVLGLNILKIGSTYLLEGTVLAWLLMLAVAWLKG
ncbi:MAG: hypothetical protein GXP37_11625 [Chloroflexi bacterium]|nr:hypothetical protein [Chloroflexota bacterium]